jgi:hypothetical protein
MIGEFWLFLLPRNISYSDLGNWDAGFMAMAAAAYLAGFVGIFAPGHTMIVRSKSQHAYRSFNPDNLSSHFPSPPNVGPRVFSGPTAG